MANLLPLIFLNYRPISFSLGEVYRRLTSKDVVDAHKAECDVNMLIECAAHLGQAFVDWANENTMRFGDVPVMEAGRRLGT